MLRGLLAMTAVGVIVLALGLGSASGTLFAGAADASGAASSLSTGDDDRRSPDADHTAITSSVVRSIVSQRGGVLAAFAVVVLLMVRPAPTWRRATQVGGGCASREHRLGSRRRGPPLPA